MANLFRVIIELLVVFEALIEQNELLLSHRYAMFSLNDVLKVAYSLLGCDFNVELLVGNSLDSECYHSRRL